eukprot:COSAG02_NODE_5670_length_4141_cov_14.390648_1_plen_99_part_00
MPICGTANYGRLKQAFRDLTNRARPPRVASRRHRIKAPTATVETGKARRVTCGSGRQGSERDGGGAEEKGARSAQGEKETETRGSSDQAKALSSKPNP